MSELSRRGITRFRIIEPNLYGAGLSPPLFVRVIKVPNYRSPNYQGNTVYAGRWTRLRCRRWVRVGCSIATRAINTCQTGSVDTSPRPRYASCLGKNNLHHTAFLWTTSAVPRVFSKGCILDSRLQCTRMFGILLVCGLRVYGCLCCAHIPVTSGGTR